MGDAIERLLHRLALEPAESPVSRGAAGSITTWVGEAGQSALNMSNRLFGGMVFAQTIVAAGRSYPERGVHSVQQFFLRAGRADLPLHYRTEMLFDGRTYASMRVEVHQGDHIISHAQIGLTAGVDGPSRYEPRPAHTTLDATVNRDGYRNRPDWQDQPVEIRVDPTTIADGEPTLETWLRPTGPLPDDPLLHQAVLGYVSDRAFMTVAYKPHGDDYKGATLDHTIWFHRPVSFDDWHRYSIFSPNLHDGRGLVQGSIIDPAGTLVATTTQQGTFRAK